MLELIGNYNIFDLPKNSNEALCITTNGMVKYNGKAVMGRGIAKQANELFHLDSKLGLYLKTYGNRAFNLGKTSENGYSIFTFPTKNKWQDDSDIELICKSAHELVEMCDKFHITKCYTVPPGCGCGNLNWEYTVKPFIKDILDDRFTVIIKTK